jgi:hypothetical protein
MFATGEDENLELLTRGSALKHPASVYGKTPYYPADLSTLGGVCSCLNPYAGPYYLTVMISRGSRSGRPSASHRLGQHAHLHQGHFPDQDSTKDYPKIGGSCCWSPTVEGCLITMVDSAPSKKSASKYPTIERSEASNARTPDDRLV